MGSAYSAPPLPPRSSRTVPDQFSCPASSLFSPFRVILTSFVPALRRAHDQRHAAVRGVAPDPVPFRVHFSPFSVSCSFRFRPAFKLASLEAGKVKSGCLFEQRSPGFVFRHEQPQHERAVMRLEAVILLLCFKPIAIICSQSSDSTVSYTVHCRYIILFSSSHFLPFPLGWRQVISTNSLLLNV